MSDICSRCGLPGKHESESDCISALVKKNKLLAKTVAKFKSEERLNDLTGAEWLFSTNTWWDTNYPMDPSHKLRSKLGSVKPPGVGAELTRAFTQKKHIVVDTFVGTGGLLLGADIEGRTSLGCELNPEMIEVIERVRDGFGFKDGNVVTRAEADRGITMNVECSSCLDWMRSMEHSSVHFVMTDPPYGIAHKKKSFKDENNFSLDELEPDSGWGKLATIEEFLESMQVWASEARRILKNNRYVAVFMSDRYMSGRYINLGARVQDALEDGGLVPKAVRVWRNKSSESRLRPYAIGSAYVPNIKHQYVLIHRRED